MSILKSIIKIGNYNYRRFELKTCNYLLLRRFINKILEWGDNDQQFN